MPLHRFADPNFWDNASTPSLKWVQDLARSAGLELAAIALGTEHDEHPPMVQLLQIPPGGILPRHAHQCWRVEVVIRGAITVADQRTLRAGDVMTSKPGEFYGPHTAGDEGALTVEVFSDCAAPTVFADPHMANVQDRAERGAAQFTTTAQLRRGHDAPISPTVAKQGLS